MNLRATTSTVTFAHAFVLSGYDDELPAGEYELFIEEEPVPGLSFSAYRRTATYLRVRGRGGRGGHVEMRPIAESDQRDALTRDRALTEGIG